MRLLKSSNVLVLTVRVDDEVGAHTSGGEGAAHTSGGEGGAHTSGDEGGAHTPVVVR